MPSVHWPVILHTRNECLCTIYRPTFNMVKCQTANLFIVSPPTHPPSQTKNSLNFHSMQNRDSILCRFYNFRWFTFSKRPDHPPSLTPILNKLLPPTSPFSNLHHQRHLSQPIRLQKRLGSGCLCKIPPHPTKRALQELYSLNIAPMPFARAGSSMRGVFQQCLFSAI